MTQHLMREVDKLKQQILALSAEVEESVHKAVKAVHETDFELGESVVNSDEHIDQREVEVEEECLKILALHQPVATDLRFIIAVLKINNDLERIGDLAANIGKRAMALSKLKSLRSPFDLSDMSVRVKGMLRKSLEALVQMDVKRAKEVLASDDEVDLLNKEAHRAILEGIKKTPEVADHYIIYLSVSRNLERIADHATNIAEDVIYMTEGEIIRHGRGFLM